MNAMLALPCSFTVLAAPGPTYYRSGFAGQIDGLAVVAVRIVEPDASHLAEWAKSCLMLGVYGGQNASPFGGWSPGRSVVVRATEVVGPMIHQEIYFYKADDFGATDVIVFGPMPPNAMQSWQRVWQLFVIAAWNMLSNRGLSVERAYRMIRGETSVWSQTWITMLYTDLLGLVPRPMQMMRSEVDAWARQQLREYEDSLVRLPAQDVFVQNPLNVVAFVRRVRANINGVAP